MRASRGGRIRRAARRGMLGAAAASLVAGIVAPGVGAQEEPPALPDIFGSAASASGLQIELLTPPLLPVEGLFDFRVAEGRGTYDPSNQEARASLLFPGNGLILGPGLACSQFPPEARPVFGPVLDACAQYQFPLVVIADSLHPDGQTEGALALGAAGDPLALQALGGRAHAGLDATTTDSEVADLRVTGAPAVGSLDSLLRTLGLEPTDDAIVAVDGVTASTDQRIVDGALVTESRATVSGLRLLGGLVRIGSIVSRSAITAVPGDEPVRETSIELGGVSVAGTPAQVTEDGLVVGGSTSGPLAQQLASQVSAFLQASGLRVELLPVEEAEVNGIPAASVGGVLIEFETPVAGLPAIPAPPPLGEMDINGDYGVRIQAGVTGVRGFADDFDDVAPVTVRPAAPVAPVGGASPAASPPAAGVTPRPAPGPAAPPAAVPEAPPAVAAEPAGALADLFADRMVFLYLSFTLTAMGLCLSPKLMVPARLPGAAP